ncbi:unnamed protein product, partial [marine sediment metagenome]
CHIENDIAAGTMRSTLSINECSDITVDNNVIVENRYGIGMGSSYNCTITRNTINNAYTSNIMMWGCNDTTISFNKIAYSVDDNGIYIGDKPSTRSSYRISIIGNHISNMVAGVGIKLNTGIGCSILGNTINNVHGIVIGSSVAFNSSQNMATGNTIVGNGKGVAGSIGIYVTSESTGSVEHNTITGNTISDYYYATYIYKGSSGLMTSTVVSSNIALRCDTAMALGSDSGAINQVTVMVNDFSGCDNGLNDWGTINNRLPSNLGSDALNQW